MNKWVVFKVQIFWECHKNLKKSSTSFWRFWWVMSKKGKNVSNLAAFLQYENFASQNMYHTLCILSVCSMDFKKSFSNQFLFYNFRQAHTFLSSWRHAFSLKRLVLSQGGGRSKNLGDHQLKFIFFEKATKIYAIFLIVLTFTKGQ